MRAQHLLLKKGYIFKLITKGLGFNFSILNKKLKYQKFGLFILRDVLPP